MLTYVVVTVTIAMLIDNVWGTYVVVTVTIAMLIDNVWGISSCYGGDADGD
jgi:hypothetical protein